MEKNSSRSLPVILLVFLVPCLLSASDVDFPLVQSFSYFPYLDHRLISDGRSEFTIDLGYSNIYMFNYDRTVVNDFEMGRATFGFRYPVLKNITAEFYLRTGFLTGGVMDHLIEDFHDLTGIKNDAREEYPRNTVTYQCGGWFSYDRSVSFAGPLIAGVLAGLVDGDSVDINFRAALGIPLGGKTGINAENPFLTTGIIFLYNRARFEADLSFHVSFYKIPDVPDPEDIRSRIFFVRLKTAYKKIFGGFLFRSSPFRHGDLSNRAFQLYIGYRVNRFLSISMYEEIPPMDTVPDVTFRIVLEFK